ncbi:MAG: hypothetical protein JXD21_02755 [Candidatus Omnitrophica bacterium]|nr:hypothetical protein [Candidatus Omnitrophota bacterium]
MNDLQKFVSKTAAWCVYAFLFCVAVRLIILSVNIEQYPFKYLYQYQIDKIDKSSGIQTVFIGDSSLGNSISAEEFSRLSRTNSMNAALTGYYGFAGQYNLLKRIIKKNLQIKNVIVMNTLDMMGREISYQGYLYSIGDIQGLLELAPREKLSVIKALYTTRGDVIDDLLGLFKTRKDNERWKGDDYIKQQDKKQFLTQAKGIPVSSIEKDKTLFLKKIIILCKTHGINLLYLHGPLWDSKVHASSSYITQINGILKTTGITLIDHVFAVPNAELGDSADHITPPLKAEYTKKYYDLIRDHLIVPAPDNLEFSSY